MTVNSISEGIDDTTEEVGADGHIHNGTSSFDNITFLNLSVDKKQ